MRERTYITQHFLGYPTGLLLSYRKTHLWEEESVQVKTGDCFRSCNWQGTKIGHEYKETAHAVASMGIEQIVEKLFLLGRA